MRAEDGERVQQ